MIFRERNRPTAIALVVATLATACPAVVGAQSSENCTVPSFRGATSPSGARATMTLVNDGRPCSFTVWIQPELRVPPDQIRVIRGPQNGTLTITPPGTVHYTPHAGFTGSDSFVYGGPGRNRSGELLTLLITIDVTVLPNPAGGR